MIKNLILGIRQNGKTRKLIEHCSKDKYSIIVCPNRQMCRNTFRMAEEMGMPIPMPITFEEFVAHQWYGKYIDNFYFDELQMCLENFARDVNIADVVFDVSNTNIISILNKNSEIKAQKGEVIDEFIDKVNELYPNDTFALYKLKRIAGQLKGDK